ncbi:hypothetical protein [Roseobacter sp. MH60115]|uniref:hypothetical protein n=1 Tax=Roseobacter sp. MH60115 TaxID=2785324 RepID=UPI0018A307A3|nr:hypothetical protein [Roseobacter sp. MH60115]
MKRLIIVFALFLWPTVSQSQVLECTTVVDCAQASVTAASEAKSAVAELAAKVDQELTALRQENENLRVALETSISTNVGALKAIPARSYVGYTPHRGGGSNAMSMASQCPNGQVMVGIEMIIGGTCRGQCNADGGAFHKYRIICSPRFN